MIIISDTDDSFSFIAALMYSQLFKLLCEKEMYGYELVSQDNLRGKSLNFKEGTLYPILYRLEDDGLMEMRWVEVVSRGKAKKYYSVTEKGKQAMTEAYAGWKAIADDVRSIMED